MKQKRSSEERILKILREAEVLGVSIGEVCRRNNITDVTSTVASRSRRC